MLENRMLTGRQYWDSITKEDLEFSVGTKQGNWDVKESLMGPDDSTDHIEPLSKRGSFYNHATSRNSFYETQSLEYNPRPASSHHYLGNNSNPRLSGHGYAQLVGGGANSSYGDVRKSASLVGERETSREQYRPSSNHGHGPLRHLDEYETQQRQQQRIHAGSGYGKQYQNQRVGSGIYDGSWQQHQRTGSSVRERSKGRPNSIVASESSRYERW